MTIQGTAHFVSMEAAVRYYRHQGISAVDVQAKLNEGDIHIGKPTLRPGDTLHIVDNGTRYAVEWGEPTQAPATHTAGKWRVEDWTYQDGKRHVPTIQTDKDAIAQVLDLWCPDDRTAERDANARLIAASPRLLAALKALSEWGRTHTSPQDPNSPHEILVEAVNAINEAEGRK